jgi:hypothetical protein
MSAKKIYVRSATAKKYISGSNKSGYSYITLFVGTGDKTKRKVKGKAIPVTGRGGP